MKNELIYQANRGVSIANFGTSRWTSETVVLSFGLAWIFPRFYENLILRSIFRRRVRRALVNNCRTYEQETTKIQRNANGFGHPFPGCAQPIWHKLLQSVVLWIQVIPNCIRRVDQGTCQLHGCVQYWPVHRRTSGSPQLWRYVFLFFFLIFFSFRFLIFFLYFKLELLCKSYLVC